MNQSNTEMNEANLSQPTQHSRKLGRRFVAGALWVLILAFLGSWFGQHFLIAEILSNFRFQFCILLAIGLLFVVGFRLGKVLTFVTAVAFVLTTIESTWILLPASQPAAGPAKLRVMSYNVLATNTDFADSIQEIRSHDPDVVAIIEYANRWHEEADALLEAYPYHHREPRWHGYGIAIFSKYPLASEESIQLTPESVDNPALVVKLNMNDQLIRLIACHVMSPTNHFRLQLRNQQYKKLAQIVNAEDVPTVLMGDFNATSHSSFLNDLIQQSAMRDSRQGFGLQPTWPNFFWPLQIPIDHAFVSAHVHVENRYLGQAKGSDHCPVIIDVSFGDADTTSNAE